VKGWNDDAAQLRFSVAAAGETVRRSGLDDDLPVLGTDLALVVAMPEPGDPSTTDQVSVCCG
jgi:hypothetical protein